MINVFVAGRDALIKAGFNLCILYSLTGGGVVAGCYASGAVLSGFSGEASLSAAWERRVAWRDQGRVWPGHKLFQWQDRLRMGTDVSSRTGGTAGRAAYDNIKDHCRVEIAADKSYSLNRSLTLIPENCDIFLQPGGYLLDAPVHLLPGQRLLGVVNSGEEGGAGRLTLSQMAGTIHLAAEDEAAYLPYSLVSQNSREVSGSFPDMPVLRASGQFQGSFLVALSGGSALDSLVLDLQGVAIQAGQSCHHPLRSSATEVKVANLILLDGSPCYLQDSTVQPVSSLVTSGVLPQPLNAALRHGKNIPGSNGQQTTAPSGESTNAGRSSRSHRKHNGKPAYGHSRGEMGSGMGGGRHPDGDGWGRPTVPADAVILDIDLVESLVNYILYSGDPAQAITLIAQALDLVSPRAARNFVSNLMRLVRITTYVRVRGARDILALMGLRGWHILLDNRALIRPLLQGTFTGMEQMPLITAINQVFIRHYHFSLNWLNSRGQCLSCSKCLNRPVRTIVASIEQNLEPAQVTLEGEIGVLIGNLTAAILNSTCPQKALTLVLNQIFGEDPGNHSDDYYLLDNAKQLVNLLIGAMGDSEPDEVQSLLEQVQALSPPPGTSARPNNGQRQAVGDKSSRPRQGRQAPDAWNYNTGPVHPGFMRVSSRPCQSRPGSGMWQHSELQRRYVRSSMPAGTRRDPNPPQERLLKAQKFVRESNHAFVPFVIPAPYSDLLRGVERVIEGFCGLGRPGHIEQSINERHKANQAEMDQHTHYPDLLAIIRQAMAFDLGQLYLAETLYKYLQNMERTRQFIQALRVASQKRDSYSRGVPFRMIVPADNHGLLLFWVITQMPAIEITDSAVESSEAIAIALVDVFGDEDDLLLNIIRMLKGKLESFRVLRQDEV